MEATRQLANSGLTDQHMTLARERVVLDEIWRYIVDGDATVTLGELRETILSAAKSKGVL